MNLYKVHNGLGDWWIIATDPTSAQNDIEDRLDIESYGLSCKRKVTSIELIASELVSGLSMEWFFSSRSTLLLPRRGLKYKGEE